MMQEMKDSGIKWIGDIPADWPLLKMKYYSYMKGRIGWQGLTADEFIDEGPYLVTGTDFENGRVCWDRSYHISEKRYNEAIPIQLQIGDLLVTKDGTIGKLAYIDELPDKASLNSHLLVIRPVGEKYINRFLYWVLSSTVFQGYYELVSDGSTMSSLSQEKIGEFQFFAPLLAEQQAIADFLDVRCAKLDSIIADLERQIEILQEYKKSVITHAVTKGLNPDAPMKDSGVDWIGEIPEHWETKRLKYLGTAQNGLTYEPIDMTFEEGTLVLRSSNIQDGKLDLSDTIYVSCKIPSAIILQKDDILLCSRNGSRRLIGKSILIDERTQGETYGAFMCVFRSMHNRFLHYVFQSEIFNYYLATFLTSTVNQLTNFNLCNMVVPITFDKHEQMEIVEYLDIFCIKTEGIISQKQKALETMKNAKSSLIYEYVTGKKRVKEAAIHAD